MESDKLGGEARVGSKTKVLVQEVVAFEDILIHRKISCFERRRRLVLAGGSNCAGSFSLARRDRKKPSGTALRCRGIALSMLTVQNGKIRLYIGSECLRLNKNVMLVYRT